MRLPVGEVVDRVGERVPVDARAGLAGVGLEQIRPGTLELLETIDAATLRGAAHAFCAGDLLFGRLRPGFRKLVRARRSGICSPEAFVLRVRPGFDPDYVLHRLAAPDVIAQAVAAATGSRMPRVSWESFAALVLPWPTLEEQRRRSAPLAALDAARRADRQAVQAMVALAEAALQQVPRERVPLGTIARLHRRPAPEVVVPELPCFGVAELDPGRLAIESWGRAADVRSLHYGIRRGDLLFSRIRPLLRKLGIAPVHGIGSPELLVLQALRPAHQGLLAIALREPGLAERVHAVATGTRMPRVHWTRLQHVELDWPRAPSPALLELCAAVAEAVLAVGARRRAALDLREQLSAELLL